ncbi:MAG: hypothetical protein F4187_01950 [Gemmatimonadetes bacterium]|nr:hypothetical protein [Gemmatimonadota bacterium]
MHPVRAVTYGLLGGCLLGAGVLAACSVPFPRHTVPVPAAEAGAEVLDPVGTYDLTMSSDIMVAEGTMEIRGRPGRYVGTVAIGSFGGRIVSVEPGAGQLVGEVDSETGRLVFRLTADGAYLSGNWVLGQLRGTIVAERSRGRVGYSVGASGGPVSTGRSVRPPHSDQDPS